MPKSYKSKKDEPCFTRGKKGGGTYTTCVGAQAKKGTTKGQVRKTARRAYEDLPAAFQRGARPTRTGKLKKEQEAEKKKITEVAPVVPAEDWFARQTALASAAPTEAAPNISEAISSAADNSLLGSAVGGGDKDLFMDVMNILATRNQQRVSESIRPHLQQFSIAQLKTAIKKDYEEKNPGMTMTKRGNNKEMIIDYFVKNKVNVKFLPKKGRKEPTLKYTIEGFNLIDEETGDIPHYLQDTGMDWQIYPSGFTAFTGKLTKQQARELAIEIKSFGGEEHMRFYRETPTSRIHFWDDPI